MSDYMFMLESHLTGEQNRIVSEVRRTAEAEHLNVFLTGGAMRDMLGGFPIRDLDFTIEGGTLKFFRALAQSLRAEVLESDDTRKSLEIRFGQLTASLSMSRLERYAKPAGKPQVQPATIHEDLRGRDFTVNAIALSLGKGSRGLLLDPMNGLGDLGRRELRTVSNHALYDDPSRLLRLIRLKVRLAFNIDERTESQFRNVREAGLDAKISTAAWAHEFQQIALDPLGGEIFKALDDEKLLALVSPALTGPKLNLPGFAKLAKAKQLVPYGTDLKANLSALFLFFLLDKLSPRERSGLVTAGILSKQHVDAAMKLDAKASKLEKDIAAARVNKPSKLYTLLNGVSGELILLTLARSTQRSVVDRLKNYLQKYVGMAAEVTDGLVTESGGGEPGTPKFDKLKQKMIVARLDARPKKVVVEEPAPPVVTPPIKRSVGIAR